MDLAALRPRETRGRLAGSYIFCCLNSVNYKFFQTHCSMQACNRVVSRSGGPSARSCYWLWLWLSIVLVLMSPSQSGADPRASFRPLHGRAGKANVPCSAAEGSIASGSKSATQKSSHPARDSLQHFRPWSENEAAANLSRKDPESYTSQYQQLQ